jgi:hypothetical protein
MCLIGSAIGASRSQNSVRISATIQHAAPSRSKKFSRLKPRLNGNFSLGLVSTALKTKIYGNSGAPGTIRTSDPQIRSLTVRQGSRRSRDRERPREQRFDVSCGARHRPAITIESSRPFRPRRFYASTFLLPLPRHFHQRNFKPDDAVVGGRARPAK